MLGAVGQAALSPVVSRRRSLSAQPLCSRVAAPVLARRTVSVRASAQPALVLSASADDRSSMMHDFCLTLPYGFLVALGGVIGFALKGSIPSLAAGGGSGLALMLLGVGSLKTWQKGKKGASAPFTLASAGVAGMLTFVMGKRFLASGAIFPAGVIAGLSGVMLLFYLYNLAAGGNPLPSSAKKA